MEFIFKKTYQLSSDEKSQICSLFEDVFGEVKSLEQFENEFGRSTLGYSYHGLMMDHNRVVGAYTSIPFRYKYFGQDRLFALSVDTMVMKDYRGKPSNLQAMCSLVYNALKEDNISFVFGFPNENIYLLRKKKLGARDIGTLNYYMLPIRIGAIIGRFKLFNVLSGLLAGLANRIPAGFIGAKNSGVNNNLIEKHMDKDFIAYRYGFLPVDYKIVYLSPSCYFVYSTEAPFSAKVAENVKTAFLIDAYPLCRELMENAVKYIYQKEGSNIDAILYVGVLKFSMVNLYKVPKRFEPRPIRMTGRILINELIDDRIFDLANWNVNLSNFDVI